LKCWNCGAENDGRIEFCGSCAAPMGDPRNGEPSGPIGFKKLKRLLYGLIKVTAMSLISALFAICLLAGMVWVYDTLLGNRILAGIGMILAFSGFLMTLSYFLVGGVSSKRMVVFNCPPGQWLMLRAVFPKTVITMVMKSMRTEQPQAGALLRTIFVLAGAIVMAVGLLLW